jgi:KUP system potassium uptake protein
MEIAFGCCALAATGFFFVVDLAFWASNMLKLFEGGWFPLLIGAVVFTLMLTWHDGRRLLNESLRSDALRLPDFLEAVFISPPTRVEGTAVFLDGRDRARCPTLCCTTSSTTRCCTSAICLSLCAATRCRVWTLGQRLEVTPLGHDCWQVIVNYGFKDNPDLPSALASIEGRRLQARPHDDQLFPVTRHRDPDHWWRHGHLARKTLCPACTTTPAPRPRFLNLPTNAVVELGSKIEI